MQARKELAQRCRPNVCKVGDGPTKPTEAILLSSTKDFLRVRAQIHDSSPVEKSFPNHLMNQLNVLHSSFEGQIK